MVELSPIVRRFVQDAGHMTQAFGLGRVVGQIYAFLYFSPVPRNLSDLEHALAISKGAASMGVRQLERWGAVRKVWVKGDRKDYYEADDWFGHILKNAVLDTMARKLADYGARLEEAERELAGHTGPDGEAEFLRERLSHLRAFHGRMSGAWQNPILRRLLR